jgi:uncharacterized NAD-dependent epimerase/dehydratase family protein
MKRKIVILTEGVKAPRSAKTAMNLVRYKTEEVVAIYHKAYRGRTCADYFGIGGAIPVIGSISEAPNADTLVIGIAPPGGKLPQEMKDVVLEAIANGMHIVSGLHEFCCNDAEIVEAAQRSKVELIDIRKNLEHEVANRQGINEQCLRILTVGHDCNIGKMVTSLELSRALSKSGHDAKFVPTGQTGILIEGDGCPIDAVVADFINGAAERLVLNNQHHEILLIEGQGSIIHPRYSPVTLGLLHGCIPHGLILCYEMGREVIYGLEHIRIPSLSKLKEIYEAIADASFPAKVIGIAMNSRNYSDAEAKTERHKVAMAMNLPVCDVIRNGPQVLVEAILKLQQEVMA